MDGNELVSRRSWLVIQAGMISGASLWVAQEAVASTALEHPEWDMDEMRTWTDWQSEVAR